AFVHVSVTVVIHTIANLARRAATRPARIQKGLVGLAITIIIDVVADFFSWKNLVFATAPFTGHTGLCSGTANANILSTLWTFVARASLTFYTGLITTSAFVDDAVTIVIEAVTSLYGWRSASSAGIEHTIVNDSIAVVV